MFKDSFSEGIPQMRWMFFPHYFGDNIGGEVDHLSIDGDGGSGVLRNSNAGGFAALSYMVTPMATDFFVEAHVFCNPNQGERGPISGLAFLVDPYEGKFYRFVCNFNSKNPSFNVAYVGSDTRHFPVYLRFWPAIEVLGEFPKKGSFYKFGILVKKGKARFFLNGMKLVGEVDTSRVKKGFVGVYANFVGGLGNAETKVDAFTLRIDR
ncbi:MAG: hypothetical protein N2513_10025 [Deltaproteobacteria bacterium]|nr:hypothetical protein [Deltaproteobacteria bacterium]